MRATEMREQLVALGIRVLDEAGIGRRRHEATPLCCAGGQPTTVLVPGLAGMSCLSGVVSRRADALEDDTMFAVGAAHTVPFQAQSCQGTRALRCAGDSIREPVMS